MPKFNMYQSLHTTVIGPGGKAVELQIRTFAMHRRAEYGVAAHWKYKERSRASPQTAEARATARRRHGLAAAAAGLAEGDGRPHEFLDSLRFDLSTAEVYVFTPKGMVIAAARRARRRWTSPTRSTPRSATTP